VSYILDALRKSERARRLGRAPVYRDGVQPVQSRLLRGLSIAAGAVLLAALGLSAWLLNRPEVMTAAPVTAAETAAGAVPEPAGGAPRSFETKGRTVASFATEAGAARTEAAPARAPKRSSSPAGKPEEAPWLNALPDEFRAALPPLMVNIHVYALDEGQRILYINNRPLKSGEEIDGVVVEEIVPEGVVLRAHGQRFKLPRPS